MHTKPTNRLLFLTTPPQFRQIPDAYPSAPMTVKRGEVMKRILSCSIIFVAVGILTCTSVSAGPEMGNANPSGAGVEAEKSSPPDLTPYVRAMSPEDLSPKRKPAKDENSLTSDPNNVDWDKDNRNRIFLTDVVVSNTDPNLTNADTANDGETSIAINPSNPREITISALSGEWGDNAPIYNTTNGGRTWTRALTVPRPPGWAAQCPCEWTWDYGRKNQLSVSILASIRGGASIFRGGFDIIAGTTTNPEQSAAFNYFVPSGASQAQEININSPRTAFQPWLLVNRDPMTRWQDNIYVAWRGSDLRVAVSYGLNPPVFTQNQQVGDSPGSGLRLAKDRRTGIMWALWGRGTAAGVSGELTNVDYMLNRSTDGGKTWSLNNQSLGTAIANAEITNPLIKFGTVNALIGGGVHHASVDSKTGALYYVYGNRDAATGNDRLAIRQITADRAGNTTIGSEHFVTGQVKTSIPQVAVTNNGTVGVFYYTFDGFSEDNFPIFTTHLAISKNQGVTFVDREILTFLSPVQNNGSFLQQVLGSYMQMKSEGNCFYGAFTGNGAAFGRPFANNDPIFFKTCVKPDFETKS
jgi:hypothetical protein